MKTVTQLLKERRAITKQIQEATKREYPIGGEVRWYRAGHWHFGKIIDRGYCGERFKVKNRNTNSEQWINLPSIDDAEYRD